MKKRLLTLALCAGLLGAVVGPAPQASATITGAVVLECTAHLPNFPAANPTAGTCNNHIGIPAAGVGLGAGLDNNGNPYVVAPSTTPNFSANFTYNEACLAGEPPVIGSASGTATSPVTVVSGTSVVSSNLVVTFSWTRVGLTAVITIDSASLTASGSFPGASGTAGAAAAAFAPVLTPQNVCDADGNGGHLDALVAGAAVEAV